MKCIPHKQKNQQTQPDTNRKRQYTQPTNAAAAPNRDKCTKAKDGRQIQQSKTFELFRSESLKNITTEKGILLRMNRSIQVEGAFGVLKQDYSFRRFLTRGRDNVTTEIFLLCFAYNINKYNHKQRDKRTQTYLFKKHEAA